MNFQRKKTAIRLFNGPAGSPLARITKPVALQVPTPNQESVERLEEEIIKRRGRPRLHEDANARQRACRARKALSAEARRREHEVLKVIRENYDMKGRLSGEFSGDNGSEKIALIDAAAERTWQSANGRQDDGETSLYAAVRAANSAGRRVTPTGWSCKKNEETRAEDRKVETDFTWIHKQKFPLNWKLDAQDKREILHDLAQCIFEAGNRTPETVFDPDVTDTGIQKVLTCTLCRVSVNILSQALEHTELYHGPLYRAAIKTLTPKKVVDCNPEHHEFLQKRGDKFCPRCKKNFVTDPAVGVEATNPLLRRQLAVLNDVDRSKGRQDSPPGVSAATT
jgi:hypothetical protein